MDNLFQDIRYALRILRKSPAFTAVALLTLALGIGVNTAMFSVVKAILLNPLRYKDSERLVVVNHLYPNLKTAVSAPAYMHYRENNHTFDSIAAMTPWDANLTGQGEPERLGGLLVTASLFDTLGRSPAVGRSFSADEDGPGRNQVAIISYGLWQRRFGGDPGVLEKSITLNERDYAIVGVMPEGFRLGSEFNNEFEIYSPIAFTTEQLSPQRLTNEYLEVYARLKPGVAIEQAQLDMDSIIKRIEWNFSGSVPFRPTLRGLQDDVVGDIRPSLLVLSGAVAFVLLIACANVASLLLARASSRDKEFAIRIAVGGGRSRIVRQFLTESLILASLGGTAGLLLAVWTLDALAFLNQAGIPRAGEIGIDRGVLLFTVITSLGTGLFFGIVPALRTSKFQVQEGLKAAVRPAGSQKGRFQRALIVSQIAIALVLLTGAGLLIESFRRVQRVSLGFETKDLLVLQVSLPVSRFADNLQTQTFFDNVLSNIRGLPGIQSADAISHLPLGDRHDTGGFQIEGRQTAPGQPGPSGDRWRVSEDYFKTMQIPIHSGRFFTVRDSADAPTVVIVDETFARKYFRDENPIGKRLSFPVGFQNGAPRRVVCEIIGVVGHVKHWSIERDNPPQYYLSERQLPQRSMYLVVRTTGEPLQFAGQVRAAVQSVDPDLPVFSITSMENIAGNSLVQRRLSTILLGGFAFLALALALIGLYGLVSYAVAQRTREIGIRMAIGAMQLNVLRMILRDGMVLVAIGLGLGLAGALLLTRLMANLLFGVTATDPITFVVVSIVLIACAFGALVVPARRATRIDPLAALRLD